MNPRKNVFLALLVAVCIMAAGYIVSAISHKAVTYQAPLQPLVAVESSTTNAVLSADSDGDGLSDWEEALWKTDPHKADTDGDGTPDGAEVRAGRDPLVKGPNDKIETAVEVPAQTEHQLTPTEKLSRDVLTTYLQLKQQQANGSGNPPSLEDVLKQNEVKITATEYTPDQFSVVYDSPQSINAYANYVVGVLRTYLNPNQQSEIEILQTALQKDDPNLIKQLSTRADNYRAIVKSLLTAKVPQSALMLHTDFVNTVSLLAETVNAMSMVQSDSVTALSALTTYQSTGLLFDQQFTSLNNYFKQHSVQFTQ